MRLGVDFGTSNTAAAVMAGDRPYVIPLEAGERTQPTAVFLDGLAKRTDFGHAAVRALVDGREGRFMRALKSVLGTPLMHERRRIQHERLTLIEVVARFLSQVKAQAEASCGMSFDAVLSGRPVRFHPDLDRDARAEADLATCYRHAGFTSVDFMPEPEAAAIACGGVTSGHGLIVDIGGGTSDFTVFRGAPGAIEVIASHGLRLGGTDFDRLLSIAHVMPLLGLGTDIRALFGTDTHTAPNAIFNDLATWEKIPFLYTAETRRAVTSMAKMAVDQAAFARLKTVLEDELGHDVALAVETGKIAANRNGAGHINLSEIDPNLKAFLTNATLQTDLGPSARSIRDNAAEVIARAGLKPTDIRKVVMVGGSSLLHTVEAEMGELLPKAEIERGDAFTAVVDGLAMAAGSSALAHNRIGA